MRKSHPPYPAEFRQRGSVPVRLLVLLALVAATLVATYAWQRRPTPLPPTPGQASHSAGEASAAKGTAAAPKGEAPKPAPEIPAHPFGFLDRPTAETVIGPKVELSGWALARAGIERVEVRLDGLRFDARHALPRPDVAPMHAGLPDAALAGFDFTGDFSGRLSARHDLAIVAVDREGRSHEIARRTILAPEPLARWKALLDSRPALAAQPFHLLPATSGVKVQGADGIRETYAPYESATMKSGVRFPILYLRTTRGRAHDWVFDPDWDFDRRCGERRIADDSLGSVIAHAEARRLPVLFTLNGGVWADASCDVPEWDVNDELERNPFNTQWTAKNEVPADTALRNLAGSQASPELARALTLNVYADKVRYYKRRNLQAAARLIHDFATRNPELFVGITLDPDVYILPWFAGQEWFDYNPDTLRQFRHWLRGSGPYALRRDAAEVDLSAYRRKRTYTLEEVNRIARRRFASWDEVDPPRSFPPPDDKARVKEWDDPWITLWDQFRRHLVHLHYSELAQWVIEIGFPPEKVFSAQGITGPDPGLRPQAVYLDSQPPDYDSAGVSIEGAIPRRGRLGVIVYGPNALNQGRMGTPESTFRLFQRLAGEWAAVEFSTANLKDLTYLPTYADAYRAFREITNFGGVLVSPMAWNGHHGMFRGQPDYQVHTSWRATPAEVAAFDLMLERANLPRAAKLWTFGSRLHATTDGWSALAPAELAERPGHVEVRAGGPRATLLSPAGDYVRADRYDLVVLGVADPAALRSMRVFGRRDGTLAWVPLTSELAAARLARTPAGLTIPLAWPEASAVVDQLRVELVPAAAGGTVRIDHVAVYPRARAAE
jgi:hypothetical protein